MRVAQLVEHNLSPEAKRIDATLGRFEDAKTLFDDNAKVAQLVEHNLPKVGVAGSSPVFRSIGGDVSSPLLFCVKVGSCNR